MYCNFCVINNKANRAYKHELIKCTIFISTAEVFKLRKNKHLMNIQNMIEIALALLID
jgi:hypothetical protein